MISVDYLDTIHCPGRLSDVASEGVDRFTFCDGIFQLAVCTEMEGSDRLERFHNVADLSRLLTTNRPWKCATNLKMD